MYNEQMYKHKNSKALDIFHELCSCPKRDCLRVHITEQKQLKKQQQTDIKKQTHFHIYNISKSITESVI